MSEKLKLNDELFRYVSPIGVFSYKVIGVRDYKDNTQYEVECQTCKHGYKCILLVAENEKGAFKYVSLLNYDEDNDQSYFHDCKEFSIFWRTLPEAHIECYKKMRHDSAKEIYEHKKKLKHLEDSFARLESALDLAESNYKDIIHRGDESE